MRTWRGGRETSGRQSPPRLAHAPPPQPDSWLIVIRESILGIILTSYSSSMVVVLPVIDEQCMNIEVEMATLNRSCIVTSKGAVI